MGCGILSGAQDARVLGSCWSLRWLGAGRGGCWTSAPSPSNRVGPAAALRGEGGRADVPRPQSSACSCGWHVLRGGGSL